MSLLFYHSASDIFAHLHIWIGLYLNLCGINIADKVLLLPRDMISFNFYWTYEVVIPYHVLRKVLCVHPMRTGPFWGNTHGSFPFYKYGLTLIQHW